jgi:hypothetical protein
VGEARYQQAGRGGRMRCGVGSDVVARSRCDVEKGKKSDVVGGQGSRQVSGGRRVRQANSGLASNGSTTTSLAIVHSSKIHLGPTVGARVDGRRKARLASHFFG